MGHTIAIDSRTHTRAITTSAAHRPPPAGQMQQVLVSAGTVPGSQQVVQAMAVGAPPTMCPPPEHVRVRASWGRPPN